MMKKLKSFQMSWLPLILILQLLLNICLSWCRDRLLPEHLTGAYQEYESSDILYSDYRLHEQDHFNVFGIESFQVEQRVLAPTSPGPTGTILQFGEQHIRQCTRSVFFQYLATEAEVCRT